MIEMVGRECRGEISCQSKRKRKNVSSRFERAGMRSRSFRMMCGVGQWEDGKGRNRRV